MRDDYLLTVGLEIHAELATKIKMFCNSKNDVSEVRPNINICPICLGYPGTLPVINKKAIENVLRLGVAVDGELADFTEFDRKNYFYPDIPKGYQISQYKHPLVRGGKLVGVALIRVHLEEDTAKSIHDKSDDSLLDFNRAGVPLMELVTEPVIHDAETAVSFAKELQLLLIYLDIARANMEKGEMRLEANVSVSKSSTLGTKVEVKNLNSFKSIEKAIKYEYERQVSLLEKGEKVVQETRGWDEEKEETFSQRLKEESHDYRYFPDPDLPKLFTKDILEFREEKLKATLPELPWKKRERLVKDCGLTIQEIEVYTRDRERGEFLDKVMELLNDRELVKIASNYIITDLKTLIPAEHMAELVKMISVGELSSRGAKDILKIIQTEGGDPRVVAKEKDLVQQSDRAMLRKIVNEVMKENSDAPIGFLLGQAMKKSNNKANPKILRELFETSLRV